MKYILLMSGTRAGVEGYHAWSKRAKRARGGAYIRWPVKFGTEQITAFDKVMQIRNERFPFWQPGVRKTKEERRERLH